ncbi:MAG: hypothetical protein LBQ43_02020 [Holosporales bacterium]|jgi:hypothetical protein|nr:hypothetical protein [Holosporales bacterium]
MNKMMNVKKLLLASCFLAACGCGNAEASVVINSIRAQFDSVMRRGLYAQLRKDAETDGYTVISTQDEFLGMFGGSTIKRAYICNNVQLDRDRTYWAEVGPEQVVIEDGPTGIVSQIMLLVVLQN